MIDLRGIPWGSRGRTIPKRLLVVVFWCCPICWRSWTSCGLSPFDIFVKSFKTFNNLFNFLTLTSTGSVVFGSLTICTLRAFKTVVKLLHFDPIGQLLCKEFSRWEIHRHALSVWAWRPLPSPSCAATIFFFKRTIKAGADLGLWGALHGSHRCLHVLVIRPVWGAEHWPVLHSLENVVSIE